MNTSGEVISIGLRSTRLYTTDNRTVIVPNSIIGTSQVINYSLPDPNFRVQFDFLVAGADFESIQQKIVETVRGVEGVINNKPIEVIYLSFGGDAKEIRLRWWIDNVNDQFEVQTRVFSALENTLNEAAIKTPNLTYDLNLSQKDTVEGKLNID